MAAVYAQPLIAVHNLRQSYSQPATQPAQRRHAPKQRFVAELSQCLFEFVVQLLPTAEEMVVKEDVRRLLERLIRTIEPDSRLLSFGSTANGFSLRNSDMDLCCLIDSEERLAAADLVTMLGDLLERETKFHVKTLPHARIPIVKLSLDPSPGLPFGIACDIGFENRLALENTRLLMCYAMVDPARVRTLVLFLKVWCKRRKINSPYKGTLSSYGYVLLVIYFLVHVKNPPVLPNLQQLPPLRPISQEEIHVNGHNVWFFDDINLLRQQWQSSNVESVAELLIDFFKFYSREFAYNTGVASIRAGLLKKDSKGWQNDSEKGTLRERNRLCIEDPFEIEFNVARCVTKDGLYTIRGEFMRASRILAARPDRAIVALSQLCEERKEEELLSASPSRAAFIPPRLSPIPPQTPYSVGSNPMRPNGAPVPDRLSPSQVHEAPAAARDAAIRLPPDQLDHMAPKRAKWTSPPPPDAPEADRSAFRNRLDQVLALATAAKEAREREHDTASSSNNSEIFTDDEDHRSDMAESDDVRSIRSYTEDPTNFRRNLGHSSVHVAAQTRLFVQDPSSSRTAPTLQSVQTEGGPIDPKLFARLRGRPTSRLAGPANEFAPDIHGHAIHGDNGPTPPPRLDTPRRSLSGPPRTINRLSTPTLQATAHTPLSSQGSRSQDLQHALSHRANVFYETTSQRELVSRVPTAYAMPVAQSPSYIKTSRDGTSFQFGQSSTASFRHSPEDSEDTELEVGPDVTRQFDGTPVTSTTPLQGTSYSHTQIHTHAHSHSTTTITAATPPPNTTQFSFALSGQSSSTSRSPGYSTFRSPALHEDPQAPRPFRCVSPMASASSASGSPPMSCHSSQYAASVSPLSTSPPSPTHSEARPKDPANMPPPIPDQSEEPSIPPIPTVTDLRPVGSADQPHIPLIDVRSDEALADTAEHLSLGR